MTQLINETAAAKVLGVSVHWMRRARWAGGGPPYCKINGDRSAVRYRPEDLEAFISARIKRSTSDKGR